MRRVPEATPSAVFVDGTGRRRRVVTIVGAGVAAALLVALGLLVSGVSGRSPLHLPGLPNLPAGAPAPAHHSSSGAPEPGASAQPTPSHTPSVPALVPTPGRAPTAGSASATAHGRRPSQTPLHPGQSKRK